MCLVSAVSDYGIGRINQQYFQDPQIAAIWAKLNELASKIDELTNQKECVDPAKKELMEKIMKVAKDAGY